MVTCPKCKAENRPEAAFCSSCGTILFSQPAPAKSNEQGVDIKSVQPPIQTPSAMQSGAAATILEPVSEPMELAQVIPVGLQSRPVGTLFGNRFRFDSLLSQDEHEIRYIVTEMVQPDIPFVRICSNPECHTVHCPVGPDPEKFCTQCGHPLEQRSLQFMLQEADADQYSNIQQVLELNLVHPNIHPPVTTFQEDLDGETRYYLASPCSDDLPSQAEILDALEWGSQLAGALDYLQSKGVALGEEVKLSNIGLAEQKAVWRNFNTVRILPMLTDREKINNMRLLGLAIYSLITGRQEYSVDPYLPPALNSLFERALLGEGFTSGSDFTQQIELVKSGSLERLILDYQVGRRSHPGKVRTLNEDSLLSIELSTIEHGGIQPLGIFAIADGMGGHAAGDLASSLVINTIAQKALSEVFWRQEYTPEGYVEWLKGAVQAANLAVYEARQRAGNDMGSTLVMGLLIGTQAYLAHLGDSRIYLVNHASIKQLTIDHSLVQHMVSIGQISQDEARYHPQRNVIYRSLGDKSYVEVECISQPLYPHDRLLFCSDGLTSLLEDEKLQKIVLEASSPQAACDQLVEAANLAGGEDNISVVVVDVITV